MQSAVKVFLVAVVCCLIFSTAVYPQSERGAIRGTVQDSTGAVVPGATVTAVNVGTGVRTPTTTTEAGNYQIPFLPAGTYTVEVEKAGFKKLVRENVRVEVAGTTGLNLQLDVGAVSESVTVTDAAPQLKSETSEVATAVNPKTYIDLPLSAGGGRASENFIFLAPGTSGNTFDAHINGSQTLSKEIQVDGLSMTISEVGGDPRVLNSLPPEAVQEFSIATSTYSAEFGNSGGGVERFVVRSGTNDLHGALYEFLQNDKLDARSFFQAKRSIHRNNEYGGTVGGPIFIPKLYNGKNKSFFFFNYGGFKYRSGPGSSVASLPTQEFRNGNFSTYTNPDGSLIQLFDPATTAPDGKGGNTRLPFSGNQIPSNRFSTVSKNVLGYVPLPTIPGRNFQNYPVTAKSWNNNWWLTAKWDQVISSAHRLSATWNFGQFFDSGPATGLPSPIRMSRDGFSGQRTGRLSEDWIMRPNLINHFSFGLTRQLQLLGGPEFGQPWAQKVGLKNVPNNGPFPTIFIDPFNSWGQNQELLLTNSNTWNWADSLTWVKGKHNLKFGVDFRKYQNNQAVPTGTGYYTFSRYETAFPSPALRDQTGLAFASFMLGLVDQGSLSVFDYTQGMRYPYLGMYAQDDIKLTPRFTLNLGLRYDLYWPMTEVNNNYSIMDPSLPNPSAGNIPGALKFAGYGPGRAGTNRLYDQIVKTNFGPRIGFAWSLNPKTVIRSAFGVSYYPTGVHGGGNAKPPSAGFRANPVFRSQDLGLTPGFHWDDGFPTNWQHPPLIDPGFGINQGVTMWNENAKAATTRQDWNFGIQRQLIPNLMVETAYVGSKSTHLSTGVFNIMQVPTQYIGLGELLTKNINDPAVAAAGFKSPFPGFTGSLAQALRPFPQYAGIGYNNSANMGNMSYHSLQVKIEKQFSHGLFVLSSYTWSKTLTDASSALSGFFSTGARDQYNRRLEKGLSVFDTPSRFVTAFSYELPIGPGKPFLNMGGAAGKVLGGWSLTGILTYQSGVPIGVGINNNLLLFNSKQMPNMVTGVDPKATWTGKFDPNRDLFLNIKAFTAPAPNTFGNAPALLNTRVFPSLNENLGIMKRTVIKEQVNLEFRYEMFNALNRVIFGGPNANFSDPFNFGKVTSSGGGRNSQFALKLNY